jgi:uncharacterized protein (TIGR03382 family)
VPEVPETAGPGIAEGSSPPAATSVQPRTAPVALTQLPRTGSDGTPAAVALVLLAGALVLHRRTRTI